MMVQSRLCLGKDFENEYLTKREKEILKQITLGKTAKEIGRILSISFRTVESYMETLRLKLKCDRGGNIHEMIIKQV